MEATKAWVDTALCPLVVHVRVLARRMRSRLLPGARGGYRAVSGVPGLYQGMPGRWQYGRPLRWRCRKRR